jgi:hypothetical protein
MARGTKRSTKIRSAARRSRAASLGWKTRRQNAAKRSAAARKGWKTRRQQFTLKREKDTRRKTPGRTRVPAPPAPAIIRTRKELIAALERAKTKQEKIAIRQRFSSPKRKGRGRR